MSAIVAVAWRLKRLCCGSDTWPVLVPSQREPDAGTYCASRITSRPTCRFGILLCGTDKARLGLASVRSTTKLELTSITQRGLPCAEHINHIPLSTPLCRYGIKAALRIQGSAADLKREIVHHANLLYCRFFFSSPAWDYHAGYSTISHLYRHVSGKMATLIIRGLYLNHRII